MNYYYIHPLKPQYFFPDSILKDSIVKSIYHPYSLIAKFSWFLFNNFNFYKTIFKISEIDNFIPDKSIKKILGTQAPIAYNLGTLGQEQKITGIGRDNEHYFFIKYATTPLAIKNVRNEFETLRKLSNLDFTPNVISFFEEENSVLLKTDVFKYKRLSNTNLNHNIIKYLIKLSMIPLEKENNGLGFNKCFSHGDFCPWNMILDEENKLLIFDWEMAGENIIGYDLFTFIFQTNFLINPKKLNLTILRKNLNFIEIYFDFLKISNWKKYLLEFAKIKYNLETKKNNLILKNKYYKLLGFAEKL